MMLRYAFTMKRSHRISKRNVRDLICGRDSQSGAALFLSRFSLQLLKGGGKCFGYYLVSSLYNREKLLSPLPRHLVAATAI